MIVKDIQDFPGLVLATSTIERGSMPRANGTSQKKLSNRAEFLSFLGFDVGKICQARPVHGSWVSFVTEDYSQGVPEADILMTNYPNRPLAIAMADCFPVFLWASAKRAVCLIHAGWRGTVREYVIPTAVQLFLWEYSLQSNQISAFIGPGIRKCCFEVRNDENGLPNFVSWPAFILGSNGRHFADLAGIIKEQLYRSGIPNIRNCGECTYCSPRGFFSFRRDKNSLRNLAVAGFLES